VCLVTFNQNSFTVPPGMLANLPATDGANPGNVQSSLVFATVPVPDEFVDFSTSAAPQLDTGTAAYVIGELRNGVVFK
jgi:hypothetical protein